MRTTKNKANLVSSLITNDKGRIIRRQSLYTHYFFVTMAFVFIIIAVVGFGQSLHAIYHQKITLNWIVHVHGALLTIWLLLFFTQALLAAMGNLKFHRRLGQFSVVLGVLVWISMGIVIFRAHIGFPLQANISWDNVLFLSSIMNLFGLFFVWGILQRKNAAVHKRLLFLATLVLVSAGFNRVLLFAGIDPTIQWLHLFGVANKSLLGIPHPSALLFYNDLLLIPLFIYDFFTIRGIHRITLITSGVIIVMHITITMFWGLLP